MPDVAGAALGAAFNELFSLVNHPVEAVAAFRGQLKKIQTTLGNIGPIIKDIDKFNNLLHRSPEEMALLKLLLEKGQRLVSKCSKIHKLNLYRKYTHSRKLTRFNAALLESFQLSTPLLNARDEKEALVDLKEIMGCLKEIKELLISNGGALWGGMEACGSCGAQFHCQVRGGGEAEEQLLEDGASELEDGASEQLLEDGASVLLVAAPGRCRKSTLHEKLSLEAAIEDLFD